jgi:SAM-dependent methyltransferase
MATKPLKFSESKPDTSIRLDLGAGKAQQTPDGFVAVDKNPYKGVKVVDLTKRWPWKANSVDEVNCSMVIHYLTPAERVHFFNELGRVLKPGAKAQFVTPMWSSHKAWIDTRAHSPIGEGFYHTLSKAWREQQNEVDTWGLTCDFHSVIGYGLHPAIVPRNQEYQQDAVAWWKEAAQDLIATLTKV